GDEILPALLESLDPHARSSVGVGGAGLCAKKKRLEPGAHDSLIVVASSSQALVGALRLAATAAPHRQPYGYGVSGAALYFNDPMSNTAPVGAVKIKLLQPPFS